MTPDMELRITGRNNTARAFSEVRVELQKTGQAMTPLERHVSRIGTAVGMLPGVFAAAFAGVSVEQFARAIAGATHDVAELGRQAKTTNVSFEDFQSLGWAAERNQISIESLGQGLREMQDKASEFAANGGGRAAEALRAMGFNAKTTAEALKHPDEMFKQIIDRLGELDHASQIRFLGDIFGNAEGDKFLRLLDEGKAGIEALQQEARDSGLVVSNELEAAAERADLAFGKLWRQAQVGFEQFAIGVASFLAGPANPETRRPNARPGSMEYFAQAAAIQSTSDVGAGPGNWGDFSKTFGRKSGVDHDLGDNLQLRKLKDFFDIEDKATKAAAAVKPLDLGIKELSSSFGALGDEATSFASLTKSAFSGMGTALMDAWKQGGDVGANVLDMLLGKIGQLGNSLLDQGLDGLFSIGLNALMGGLGGGMGGLGRVGSFSIGGMPSYADGTMNHPGGWAVVGERGPEVVKLPGGSQVYPNGSSAGGGGVTNHFHIDARGAQLGVGEEIARAFDQFERQRLPAAVQNIAKNPYRKG